jgi:hypothetical protein
MLLAARAAAALSTPNDVLIRLDLIAFKEFEAGDGLLFGRGQECLADAAGACQAAPAPLLEGTARTP